jgi:hypothetical protein
MRWFESIHPRGLYLRRLKLRSFMARTAASLHLTSGDAALYLFRKAGILGTHLSWRDALYEGPVPSDLGIEELTRLRGTYLATRGHGNAIRLLHELQVRDETVRRAAEFEEIVLWFEHDLYDQLQILQILWMLGETRVAPGSVSLIQTDVYLGSLTAEELLATYPKRRTVTAATFAQGLEAWQAFTSNDPARVGAQCTKEYSALPHMRAAFVRLCEEFPWNGDGLSRSQRQALLAVTQGPAPREELFKRSQAREEAPFMVDRSFYAILDELSDAEQPLLEEESGVLVLSALGRRTLAGDADWIEAHSIDRWIGGVHLTPIQLARWNEERAMLQPPAGEQRL